MGNNKKKDLNEIEIGYENIFDFEPEDVFMFIQDKYIKHLPISLENPDDLILAGQLLGELTNTYSYLTSLATFAKMRVKELKRSGMEKDQLEACMSIRDIYDSMATVVKQQYTAISRMIAVKKQVDDEMRMI